MAAAIKGLQVRWSLGAVSVPRFQFGSLRAANSSVSSARTALNMVCLFAACSLHVPPLESTRWRPCVKIDRSVFAQGDNRIGANRASSGNEASGSGYQREKSHHSQKCHGIRRAYSEQQTAHQLCERQR